jgi:prophage regulatory protein
MVKQKVQQDNTRRLYRRATVLSITGFSSATLYRRIRTGDFPKPVSIGGILRAWDSVAVHQWVDDRLAELKEAQS